MQIQNLGGITAVPLILESTGTDLTVFFFISVNKQWHAKIN